MAMSSGKTILSPSSALSLAFRNLSIAPSRAFSSSVSRSGIKKLPEHIPPYPYGARRTYKQADSGLYGGATIQFGNQISDGRNKGKTRRFWKPNIRHVELHSEALGKTLKLKVQHRVIRTINKVGGLDNYLLGEKPARIKELGLFGWGLRWQVMMSNAMKERFRQEREKLGLAEPETFEQFLERYTEKQKVQAAIEDQKKKSGKPVPDVAAVVEGVSTSAPEQPSARSVLNVA